MVESDWPGVSISDPQGGTPGRTLSRDGRKMGLEWKDPSDEKPTPEWVWWVLLIVTLLAIAFVLGTE